MKFLIPILCLSLVLTSCEKSITISLPEQPKKLVLNAVIHEGDYIGGYLTRSLSNAESGKPINPSVEGAQMLLYRDGQLVDTLDNPGYGEYVSDILAQTGHHYRLLVSHPDYPTLEAETDAPGAVPIKGYTRQANARGSSNFGDQDLLNVRFNDPADAGDRYIMQVLSSSDQEKEGLDFYTWGNCISINDPSVESPYTSEFPGEEVCHESRSLFIKDAMFNGKEKELSMYVSSYLLNPYWEWQGTDTIYSVVRLFHVTPEFYQFVKSYRSSQNSSDNPFAEPFNVVWTVKGGYGVFSILSEDRIEVGR